MQQLNDKVLMFLNGTAMSGFADHIHVRGARFVGPRRTAPRYRFYSVRNEFPGLVLAETGGRSITGELYEMDRQAWLQRLLPNEPAELFPGEVELEDGSRSNVMLLDLDRVSSDDQVVEIGRYGGWRAYLAHLEELADLEEGRLA
jgi:gamma-glutamylcyclotransferase (GGCT)/AIG2-like uncharacterized protein YtfP